MSLPAPVRFGASHRRQALRFAWLANVLPVVIATLTGFSSHRTVFFVGAIGACIVPFVVMFTSRRNPLLFYAGAYGGLPLITMMQAYSGGAASGYSVLLLMAMTWYGLQASDREIAVGFGILASCAFLPMLVFGAPAYPVSWGHAALLVMVGASITLSLRLVTRETQRLNGKLREEAVKDRLTGLLNRRGWEEAANRELARSARRDSPVTFLLLDLDKLKPINDTKGHHEGDRVLRETGERMRAALRAGDIIARVGGDEFAALLSDTEAEDTIAVLDRLREITPGEGGFSVGVATWDGTERLEDVQRRCDTALYAAKATGGGRVELAPTQSFAL
jgi:diguanylate cyclase (GGDEF)-like protein